MVDKRDFKGGFQNVYDRVTQKIEAINSRGILDEESRSVLKEYEEVKKELERRNQSREDYLTVGMEKDYVKGLVGEFFRNISRDDEPRFYIMMRESYIHEMIDFMGIKFEHEKDVKWWTLLGEYTILYEINMMVNVYDVGEDEFNKKIYSTIKRWIDSSEILKGNKILGESTFTIYKEVMYGSMFGGYNNLRDYQKEWARSKGYLGNVMEESEEDIIRLVSSLVTIKEGGLDKPSKKEKQVSVRLLRCLMKEIQELQKKGINVSMRVFSLNGEDNQVFYIGERYEIVLRRYFSVYKSDGRVKSEVSNPVTRYRKASYELRVKDIEEVVRKIMFDVEQKG